MLDGRPKWDLTDAAERANIRPMSSTATPLHTCTVHAGPVPGTHAVQMHSARAFDKHWHDSFGFGLMDEGGQVSASGRGQVQALAGQIITTNPGEVHDGVPLQQGARRWRMVYLSPHTLADMLGQSQPTAVELTRPVLDDPLLHAAIDHVFRHWAGPSPADGHTVQDGPQAEERLTQVCGLLVQRHGNQPLADARHAPLRVVRECLLDQMDAPPTLAALAELAGLSRFQLVRQFAHAHGLPPFAWLQQHRVRHAQTLIAQGTALPEAALASGFADQSHLTRAFMRYLGFTPGTWQRAHRPNRSQGSAGPLPGCLIPLGEPGVKRQV